MDRTEVVSVLLKSIGDDKETQTLEVEFQPKKGEKVGNVYQYAEVQPWVFNEFRLEASLGKYFLAKIKPSYKATKIEPPKAIQEIPDAT